MKIPKWFDLLLMKRKKIHRMSGHYLWEMLCWKFYIKGKRDGLALAEERYYEATRTDDDVNP